ncbi:hypothetical protein [Acinetobacter radioresistens]|uniref:hypothetical protein n=2 Tax=Moraxellaceae TaxID=468 RepID=UPI00200457AD|nr:hypothetical protein [Acinetobacter radioresistens]
MNLISFPLDNLFFKLIKENTIDGWEPKRFLKEMKLEDKFKKEQAYRGISYLCKLNYLSINFEKSKRNTYCYEETLKMNELRSSIHEKHSESIDLKSTKSQLLDNISMLESNLDYLDSLMQKQPQNHTFYKDEIKDLFIKLIEDKSKLEIINNILNKKIIIN